MPEYTVVDIGGRQIESAYPLVRVAEPDVSFADWISHAEAVRGNGGVLGLVGPDENLFGVATYQRHHALRYGAAMFVDLLAVFELVRAGAGRRQLLDAIEAKALGLGCRTLVQRSRWIDSRGANLARRTERVASRGIGSQVTEDPKRGKDLEYGEAINSDAFARAITIANRLRSEGGESVQQAATDAVAQAYCVCVTDGEDAAEHRFSDVHRKLIDDVAEQLRVSESARSRDNRGED